MNSNTTITSNILIQEASSRKEYRSPELVLYGNISELTQMVDMTGMMDGGTGQMDKT